ncbi:MAG: acetate--CoA ligase family protein, partial [Candidatus Pelethousia sp.]|nr:acetate--CoA ligase family protein [Candidatus Pelethousia sp.]
MLKNDNPVSAACTAWEDLQPLFRPGSIAVVGASEKPGPGLQVLENLERLGYKGDIYPVNPKYGKIRGILCYPSLTAIQEAGRQVDMVAILLGRDNIASVMEEAAKIGAKAAWAFAAGFGEAGEQGKELQERIKRICDEKGIRFLGPNCVGYLNIAQGSGTYSAPAPTELRRGNIGMVAQSGYLSIAMANSDRGLGYSLMVSTGNEMVVDSTDCIAYMLEDPHTAVIMAFIEQFRSPEKLRAVAARAREVGKPIILVKVGRSEMAQRATCAHTGALAGSDAIQDKLFKKLGIIRVNDLDEMFETAQLFSTLQGRFPKGNGIFAVTLSGGVISLLADVGEGLDLRFPEWSEAGKAELGEQLMSFSNIANPLDAWGSGRIESTYKTCLFAAAKEDEADVVLVVQDVPTGMAPRQAEQYAVVAEAAAAVSKQSGKIVVLLANTSTGFHPNIRKILDEGGVPALQGTREGLRAIESLVRFAAICRLPSREERISAQALAVPKGVGKGLTEYRSKKILSAFGVRCTREILTQDPDACAAAAREIGFPVVLKVMSPQILHKTEAGVIAIGLADEGAVREAYPRLMEKAHVFAPGAEIEGMLVQEMAEKPVAEVILGITRDPQFGPAVVFGSGGILVEVLKDSALGIPPLSEEEALNMIRATKGYKLLTGFRGRPKADV